MGVKVEEEEIGLWKSRACGVLNWVEMGGRKVEQSAMDDGFAGEGRRSEKDMWWVLRMEPAKVAAISAMASRQNRYGRKGTREGCQGIRGLGLQRGRTGWAEICLWVDFTG